MEAVIILVVVGTSVWVLMDAKALGIAPGQRSGFLDMGPISWFLCCLLLWIIAFPAYLVIRSQQKTAGSNPATESLMEATQIGRSQEQHRVPMEERIPISCPGCGKVSGVPRSRIPASGVKATCKQCGHSFHVVVPAEHIPSVMKPPVIAPQTIQSHGPSKSGISLLRIGMGLVAAVALIAIYAQFLVSGGNAPLNFIGSKNFTVNVRGADLLPYTGHILIINADGTNRSQSVDGNVPKTYTFSDALSVSCSFQKHSDDSAPLALEISNGVKQETARTTSPFGVVSAAL